jgi:hypothetical protein
MSRYTPARSLESAFLVSSPRGRVVPSLLLVLRTGGVSLYREPHQRTKKRSASTFQWFSSRAAFRWVALQGGLGLVDKTNNSAPASKQFNSVYLSINQIHCEALIRAAAPS